jgi:hypothetical protein
MGRTVIPDDLRPRMRRLQIISLLVLAVLGAGAFWI